MRQFPLHRPKTHVAARASRALPAILSTIFALACAPLILVMFVAQPARAQGSRKDDIIFNAQGRPMAGATVRVCTVAATGQPCTPLANIYSDEAMTQALANPLTTDGLGNYTFYAAPGRYEIEISGPGITDKQLPNVILPNDPNNPTFTSLTTGSGLTMFSLSLSGNLTVNGSTAVNGTLTVGGAPVPSTNQQNTWTASQQFVGPTPWIDMAAFPATPACPWTLNSVPSVTISLSTPTTATTNYVDPDYVVGCSVYIPGAGPNSTIAAPTGGSIVNHDGTGSTTYKYAVVAVDANNGYGPASAQFQTTTGLASLNKWQYNFLTWTAPAGTVKEYVIYSDEGLGGALVKIGTSYFPTFEDVGFYGANLQPSPSFLPTNPPSVDGPQGLFTSITAISGTTLTLANAASTAVTSKFMYLDNKNALASAISAWCNDGAGGAQLQIGSGRWMLTSWPVPCGRGAANVKLIGNIVMVDGPLVMPESLQIYGMGTINNDSPFGNTITGGIDSIADFSSGFGDQLGAVILGSQINVLNNVAAVGGAGFQGDYIQFGDTGTDDLKVLATAAPHSGGCVIHFLSQVITLGIEGGSVLGASGDAGGKAAICFDTQYVGSGGSVGFSNLTIGSATGQNLNWQNHFISFACPICTSIRPENNIQFVNTYGEDLLEPYAIGVDPGQTIAPYGVDDLYGFTASGVGNDSNDFAGPCFGVLNAPNRSGSEITGAVQNLGCGVGTVSGVFYGAAGGMFTPSGAPDFSVAAPISLSGFNTGKIGYNQYGFGGYGQIYGLDGLDEILPYNTAVSLAPNGFEGSYSECVECWLIPAPSSLSVSVTHSVGTLAAGVHCYAVSANDKQGTPGNSVLSNEICVTNLLNDENVLTYSTTGDAGLGGVTVWRGPSSGGENVYLGSSQPTTTNVSTFTDTGSVTTTSATPVNSASAYETMLYNTTHDTGYLHGNALNDGLHFGFGCPPSGTYVWETCGNTGFDNNLTITGSLTAGGRANFFSAGGRIALTDAATLAFNVAGLPNPWGTVTLGGNRTLSVTNMIAGGNYILSITQDATGSRTLTLGTGGTGGCLHWYVSGGGGGAITLTTAAGATDLLGWKYDGTNCWAILNTNFN